jgi:hypothetical protein
MFRASVSGIKKLCQIETAGSCGMFKIASLISSLKKIGFRECN